MDQTKLERLRRQFSNAGGGDIANPAFARVAAGQFQGERRKWPFADVATFCGAPYRPDAPGLPDIGGLDVAICGVPMDLGVTNRAGARLGPRAVRAVERIGPMDHVLGTAPLVDLKVADVGDVPFRSRYSLESCHEDIEAHFALFAKAGVTALAVGGDHSISLPILKALGRGRPRRSISTRTSHRHLRARTRAPSSTMAARSGRRCWRACSIPTAPSRSASAGGEYLWEFSHESGMTMIHADEIDRMGIDAVIAKARAVIGDHRPMSASTWIRSTRPTRPAPARRRWAG